jgi:hypothetical protein
MHRLTWFESVETQIHIPSRRTRNISTAISNSIVLFEAMSSSPHIQVNSPFCLINAPIFLETS